MDLTSIANRLHESYGCDLQVADESKMLNNLNENDLVRITFPDSEEYLELYAKEIAAYLDNCDEGKLIDNLEYFSVDKYLLRIEPASETAFQYFMGKHYDLSTTENMAKFDRIITLKEQARHVHRKLLSCSLSETYWKQYYDIDAEINKIESEIISPTNRYCKIQLNYKDCNLHFSIIRGASEFGLWVTKTENYEKWYPPVLGDDLFVEIIHNGKLEIDECRTLANKYIYELSAQLGLEVRRAARAEIAEENYLENSEISKIRKKKLLMFSTRGLSKELYSLYCKAIAAEDTDFIILNYIKIIEFISQTVSRIKMYNMIRPKLEQRDSINPSVNFIEELRQIFDKLKIQMQDRELIKTTINTCCDINCTEIPDCETLQFLKQAKLAGDKQKIKDAFNRLGDIFYSTRCQIAHAKINYQKSGDECPPEDHPALIKCLKSICEQCIRWFESQAEGSKYSD